MKLSWLAFRHADLEGEYLQLQEEGKDTTSIETEYQALKELDLDQDWSLQPRIHAFLEQGQQLPNHADYPYEEPSDLESIRAARPDGPRRFTTKLTENDLYDRIHGAWVGRCAGNLLGKPVESWHSERIWGFLKDTENFPLKQYMRSDVYEEIQSRYSINPEAAFIDRVPHAVEDDDLNYTVTGLAILEKYGPDFTPEDVAEFWMMNLPLLKTYTAERTAYRNFAMLIMPPQSAVHHNPYREWIGAQIRADFWGYAALGNPELAAEYAWRDASISHVKNGIYGEMWVAAMLASAPCVEGVREVIEVGLTEIPSKCRLAADIREVIAWRDQGIGYDEAISRVHSHWNEKHLHHWCHTNSNAQIVAIGLLWGEEDFGKSICRAVQGCFDTDCNGATVGSVFGMMHGTPSIPGKWSDPLHDTLETGVASYRMVRISEIAAKGYRLLQR